MSLLIPLMLACATVQTPAPVASGEVAAVTATEAGPPAVSFAPLEERVNVLIADAQDTDRRDRLIAARELMITMRNKDAIAQRKVYEYLDQLLAIEERSQPAPINIEGFGPSIQEETIPGAQSLPSGTTPGTPPGTTPPPAVDSAAQIAAARSALAAARYLDAVDALVGVTAPEAAPLRKEAVDAWARVEREKAGHQFLEARQLPPGNERIASLRAVRSALSAINARFPENAYAAQIAENIGKVDADLTAAGARP